jgi:arsenate reductase
VIKAKVLFLCTGNSRRTQMAEGFLRSIAGDRFDVVSAGNEDTPLDPDAVLVMREVGIDISGHETKAANRFLGRRFNYVAMLAIARKSGAARSFPAQYGACSDLEDPSMSSTREERREALRRVRDDIQQRVTAFAEKNG